MGETPEPPAIPPRASQPQPKKKRTKLYIIVALVAILVVSVLLVAFSNTPFTGRQQTSSVGIDYGPLNSYVQQLENKGFQVSQGTWKEPQYYVSIEDWDNFLKWTEQVRTEHQQEGRSDPIIYVDSERSVFWFTGKISLFNYDDVIFYWFV